MGSSCAAHVVDAGAGTKIAPHLHVKQHPLRLFVDAESFSFGVNSLDHEPGDFQRLFGDVPMGADAVLQAFQQVFVEFFGTSIQKKSRLNSDRTVRN